MNTYPLCTDLRDSRLFAALSAAAVVACVAIRFVAAGYLHPAEERALLAVCMAVSIVLGVTALYHTLCAPHAMPPRFQIVVGVVLGYVPWIIPFVFSMFDREFFIVAAWVALVGYMSAWIALFITDKITGTIFLCALSAVLPIFTLLVFVLYVDLGPDEDIFDSPERSGN